MYWCEAENVGGKARSMNATLEVAGRLIFVGSFIQNSMLV